jgi:PAS domain S-box-containing protein
MIYVSPGYEKVFGRSCKSLYEDIESFGYAVHPEDKDRYINNKNGHIASKDWDKFLNSIENKCFDETFRIIRPDGEIRWIWFRGFPIRGENESKARKVGIIQDITTIKEAERELERLRTEFFANLSHEFRTPLNLIFSSLQLIELKSKGISCDNMNNFGRYSNIIKQNSFRLLRLVNNLIDTTKIDAGYDEYCSTNYDIVKYIKDICNSVAGFAKQKDIEVIFNSELEEKIISFDLDKMERIMLNLLSNAIKYNVLGGKIEVSISHSGEVIEISVKDTGIGIHEDKLTYVFERFKQVHDRLTKVSEGSGIGLCLVKSLVEMHGGTIKVKSNFDKGTEFIVKLPNIIINKSKEAMVNKNQIESNSRVERIRIEFSDIYGLNI